MTGALKKICALVLSGARCGDCMSTFTCFGDEVKLVRLDYLGLFRNLVYYLKKSAFAFFVDYDCR